MAPRRSASESTSEETEKEAAPLTREDVVDIVSELLEEAKPKARRPSSKSTEGIDRTDKQVEKDTEADVGAAFDRLMQKREHDEHHKRLAEREAAAEKRRESSEKTTAPVQADWREKAWGY